MHLNPEQVARRVVGALEAIAINGSVGGFPARVSPMELPTFMGFAVGDGLVSSKAMRPASLSRWLGVVDRWLRLVMGLVMAGKIPVKIVPGSTPSKAYPNWLRPEELEAWKQAKERAGIRIKGLEDSVRARLRTITADVIALGLPREKAREVLGQRLETAFASIAKDWARVAATELATAYNQGVAVKALASAKSPRVAVVPQAGACPKCKAAYLDASGKPKVWRAGDLLASGVCPPALHPNCRCSVEPRP